jgi:EpsI family protein
MAALRRAAPLILIAALAQLPLTISLARGRSDGELRFDATSAPQDLAHYRAVGDSPLEPEVLEMLEPDSYVMRLYRSERGPDAWLYLAGYSATDSTGAHDPAVCYPSQGWDLQEVHTISIPLASGESFTAKVLLASQAGQQELVLYWFQPIGRWPQSAPWEQLMRAYDGFAGRPGYVFVRISTQFNDLAQPTLLELAQHLAPWIRTAMLATPSEAGTSGE